MKFRTGLRLALKATSSGSLTATFTFYATQSNVSVPSGSFALTGSYSAEGFQLTPDHWITMPAGYSMVGLTAGAAQQERHGTERQRSRRWMHHVFRVTLAIRSGQSR
jgi:hypothetical protein